MNNELIKRINCALYDDARAWLKDVYNPDSTESARDKLERAYELVKRLVGDV